MILLMHPDTLTNNLQVLRAASLRYFTLAALQLFPNSIRLVALLPPLIPIPHYALELVKPVRLSGGLMLLVLCFHLRSQLHVRHSDHFPASHILVMDKILTTCTNVCASHIFNFLNHNFRLNELRLPYCRLIGGTDNFASFRIPNYTVHFTKILLLCL
jgi:hypothetical protein